MVIELCRHIWFSFFLFSSDDIYSVDSVSLSVISDMQTKDEGYSFKCEKELTDVTLETF